MAVVYRSGRGPSCSRRSVWTSVSTAEVLTRSSRTWSLSAETVTAIRPPFRRARPGASRTTERPCGPPRSCSPRRCAHGRRPSPPQACELLASASVVVIGTRPNLHDSGAPPSAYKRSPRSSRGGLRDAGWTTTSPTAGPGGGCRRATPSLCPSRSWNSWPTSQLPRRWGGQVVTRSSRVIPRRRCVSTWRTLSARADRPGAGGSRRPMAWPPRSC